MSDPPPPTVIVSRRFEPGRERDGERWLRKLRDAAAAMPGHVDSTIQPPNVQHPDEWMVVYRFSSPERLHGWLDSPQRRELVAKGTGLLAGEAREQVIALADESMSVTAVASFRLRPGTEVEFRGRYRELRNLLEGFDGFIRTELVEPVPDTQDDTAIVFSFTDRHALDRWLGSVERREILEAIDPLLDGGRTVNVIGGFAGWFSTSDTTAPKRWKQAALVLLALFPTALVLTVIREAVLPDLPMPLAVFIGNLVGVVILSWILMPALTRRFDSWLSR